MKKLFLLCGILTASLSLASCNKEADLPIEPEPVQSDMLEFASVDEMERTIYSLMDMTETEKSDWYADFEGFTSQHDFKWEVVDELDAHKKGLFGWNNYRTEYFIQRVWHDPTTWTTIAPALSGQLWVSPELPAGTIEKIGTTPQRRSGWVPGQMDLNIYTRGTGEAGIMQLQVRI